MKRYLKWGAIAVAALLLLAIAGFLIWALTPLGPGEQAVASMSSTSVLAVGTTDYGYTFAPRPIEATTGVIIYPGGRVDARSYAPLAEQIANRGHFVVIAKMPLSLAVLDQNAADAIIAAHPEITRWVLAGHSLGGAMGSTYVATHPDTIDGLLLMAAYPAPGDDLTKADLEVASLLGTLDTVVERATWDASFGQLPSETERIEIEGGNHAQFGDYGEQPGDSPATIAAEEQWDITAKAAHELLRTERE